MIVVCPACSCKYSVQAEAIGREKLVRCAMCGTTWQQSSAAYGEVDGCQHDVWNLTKWGFFWFTVFVMIFSLFFARNAVAKIWPSSIVFYEALGMQSSPRKAFVIQNLSNFFVVKNDMLYMGLKGELINISDSVQILPSITISLKSDENMKQDSSYKKVWTHNLTYKKLLPNQRVVFETELQNVPYNNLICDIALDTL
ncbi:MAG: zinc-ribbon domain-containing protein [Holosporaceae bacterium]|nr:zinc-ribbon domain-containing protein [Holosporaceae bacterium]